MSLDGYDSMALGEALDKLPDCLMTSTRIIQRRWVIHTPFFVTGKGDTPAPMGLAEGSAAASAVPVLPSHRSRGEKRGLDEGAPASIVADAEAWTLRHPFGTLY